MERPSAMGLARMRVMDRLGSAIGRAVAALYDDVAAAPERRFHFPTGARAARLAGYPEDAIASVPERAIARFAGVGCPLRNVELAPGEAVLDIGCGAGVDLVLAANAVGDSGRVVGVDLTTGMVDAARAALAEAGARHATVVQTRAPHLGVDGPFDVVTSNGALNLIPEKEVVLARARDLLRPGGRLTLADIALTRPPAAACLADAQLWAECLVGAFTEDEYLRALENAGFTDVRVHGTRDYFRHSDSRETRETAEDLGAFAWEITARRA